MFLPVLSTRPNGGPGATPAWVRGAYRRRMSRGSAERLGRELLLDYGRVDRSRRTQCCLFLERNFGLGWLVRSLADLQPSARPPQALAPLPTTPRSPATSVPNTGKHPDEPAMPAGGGYGAIGVPRDDLLGCSTPTTIVRVLPGLDVAAVRHYCEQRVPHHALHQVQRRACPHPRRGDHRRTARTLAGGLRSRVDQPRRSTPPLYNEGRPLDAVLLLDEVDRDPTCIFWGWQLQAAQPPQEQRASAASVTATWACWPWAVKTLVTWAVRGRTAQKAA
jgi:hypothetical protein